jgi:hypothetical protein
VVVQRGSRKPTFDGMSGTCKAGATALRCAPYPATRTPGTLAIDDGGTARTALPANDEPVCDAITNNVQAGRCDGAVAALVVMAPLTNFVGTECLRRDSLVSMLALYGWASPQCRINPVPCVTVRRLGCSKPAAERLK